MPEATRTAPAKVNLTLSVGAAEPPQTSDGSPNPRVGWHPLASWMVCLELADTVRVRPAATTNVRISWDRGAPQPSPIDWPVEKDLAARAHHALQRAVGRELPCEIDLVKQIPVGGGLGGGSSDAAATLLALREAFGLPIDNAELARIGASLGSDVPFFVRSHHGPALLHGYGERIEAAPPVVGRALLLVLPAFGCPTPAVYRAFDHVSRADPSPATGKVREIACAPFDPVRWFNDLEAAAESIEPRLAPLRERTSRILNRRVMMTGSGSTLIAEAASTDDPAALEREIGQGARVLISRVL